MPGGSSQPRRGWNQCLVAHLLTADTPADRLTVLATLLRQSDLPRQFTLQLGPGRPALTDFPIRRVHSPAPITCLKAAALSRVLNRLADSQDASTVILHAWSDRAVDWCRPLLRTNRPLLLEVDPSINPARLVQWSQEMCLAFVCPDRTTRQRLLSVGVPPSRTLVVRPLIHGTTLGPGRRPMVRAWLGLTDRDLAVTVLPPITRRSGAFIATWAALLLEKVRPEVRLVLSGEGRELLRIRRLVTACRHDWMVHIAPPGMPLPDLLAATDLAIHLPSGPAATTGLAWAMAAGCPAVVSEQPEVTELVGPDSSWLSPVGSPQLAAQTMLRAIENPEQSRLKSRQAADRAARLFSPQHGIGIYRQVYANLAARRPAAATLLPAS